MPDSSGWLSRFFSRARGVQTPTITPPRTISAEQGATPGTPYQPNWFAPMTPEEHAERVGARQPSKRLLPDYSETRPAEIGRAYKGLGTEAVPDLAPVAEELTGRYAEEFHGGTQDAIDRLEDFLSGFNKNIDQRIAEIQGVLPIDPYSEEQVQRNIEFSQDEINRALQQNLGMAAAGSAAKGFQGGGQLSAAGALLRGEALRGRVETGISERDKQLAFNQATNQVREAMLTDITMQRENMGKLVTGALADLEKTDVLDYNWLYGIAESLESMDLSKQMHDELLEAAKEYQASLEPGFWDYASDIMTAYGQSRGDLWPQIAGLGVRQTPDILSWLGGE